MQISARRLAEYTAALNAQQRAAFDFMQTAMRSFYELNGGMVERDLMREFAEQTLYTCMGKFGDQAAAVACSAYDATMSELGMDVPPSVISNDVSERYVKATVESLIGGDFDSLASGLANKAYASVGRAANRTTIANAERDYSKGVRYARVPTGKETCGFCLMLASRGFDYKSRKSAGDMGFGFNRFHEHCDCRVVAGDASTTVEGYDPDWLYAAYLDARATVGPQRIRDEMRGQKAEAVNKRIADAICNEINMRTRGWSWDGEAAASDGGEHSRFTDALAAHGLASSMTTREGAPLRMNGLSWGMADAGTDVGGSISRLRQERMDGGTSTSGHYVLLVDGIKDAERSALASLHEGETAILIDPNDIDTSTGLTPMRRLTR